MKEFDHQCLQQQQKKRPQRKKRNGWWFFFFYYCFNLQTWHKKTAQCFRTFTVNFAPKRSLDKTAHCPFNAIFYETQADLAWTKHPEQIWEFKTCKLILKKHHLRLNNFLSNHPVKSQITAWCFWRFTFRRELTLFFEETVHNAAITAEWGRATESGVSRPPGGQRGTKLVLCSHSVTLAGVSKPDLSQQMRHNTSGRRNVGERTKPQSAYEPCAGWCALREQQIYCESF